MDIAIDVETRGLDATGKMFVIGCIYVSEQEYYYYTSPKDMWLALVKMIVFSKHILNIYGHNIAYDFFNIYNKDDKNVIWHSIHPFIATYINNKKTKAYFLDTYSIFRMRLAKAAELINERKYETPEELINASEIIDMETVKQYLKNDCKITLNLIRYTRNKLQQDNLRPLRLITINQIAIQYVMKALSELKTEHILYNIEHKETYFTKYPKIIHEAYRSGRNECWKLGKLKYVNSIDCNSIYPWALSELEVPDLRTERIIYYPLNSMQLIDVVNKIGVSTALIYNKSDNIGLFPVRTTSSTFYPEKGSYIIGTYTNEELKYALNNGYEIIEITCSVYYESSKEKTFKPIVYQLYKKRKSGDVYDDYFYKSIANSAIGKMAQKKLGQDIVIQEAENIANMQSQGYKVLQGYEMDYVYQRDKKSDFPKRFYMPIIPALVNAKARIKMHSTYKLFEKHNLIYTDNDSIFFHGDLPKDIHISDKLGDFKIVYKNQSMVIWGRKAYKIGDWIHIAGINSKNCKIDDKGIVTYTRMNTFLNTNDINKVGLFINETRDLNQQSEQTRKTVVEYKKKKIYVDYGNEQLIRLLPKIKVKQ